MIAKDKLKLKVKKKVRFFDVNFFDDSKDFSNSEIFDRDEGDYLNELNLRLRLERDKC